MFMYFRWLSLILQSWRRKTETSHSYQTCFVRILHNTIFFDDCLNLCNVQALFKITSSTLSPNIKSEMRKSFAQTSAGRQHPKNSKHRPPPSFRKIITCVGPYKICFIFFSKFCFIFSPNSLFFHFYLLEFCFFPFNLLEFVFTLILPLESMCY